MTTGRINQVTTVNTMQPQILKVQPKLNHKNNSESIAWQSNLQKIVGLSNSTKPIELIVNIVEL